MTHPAHEYARIWVRGRFVDLGKVATEEDAYGLTGPVRFTASPPVLLDAATRQIISAARFTVTPADQDGYFQVHLPATDDPAIVPTGWTYNVIEPTGRSYNIVLPMDTPLLDSPGDPLHGQQVVDLITVVPAPSPSPGTVQLVPGRGVESMVISEDGDLVATWTDGAVVNLGYVGGTGDGPSTGEVQDLIDAAVAAHAEATAPHPAYDDMVAPVLWYQNAKI